MSMSMTGSVSSASCSAAGPTDDSRGTAFQLALGLGRLGGLGGPLPGCCPSDMAGLQDAALRESRKSCNMTECVPVPSSEHVAEIVGRQGCKIKALRAKTNTYIKTPVRGEEPVFVVTGRRDDVTSAKREILSAAEHFSQIRASRRSGAAAATAANSGGSSFCTAVAASAAVSSLGAGCSQIVGSGTAPAVAPPGHVTAMVRVPYRVVGLVVGPKGATIKRIQQATGTYIVTPSREKDPVFEITGLPESVSKARAEIERHIASRAAGVGEPMASVGEPMASVGSLCGTATAAGCFLDAGGCGVCGGCRRASDCEALLGFGNGGSCCVSYSARPCRDPTSAGSCFPYSSPLASAIAAAAAAAQQQQQAADLLDLGRLDGIAASADDIMSVRGEDDSGCASLAGDLDCAAAGGVAAAITAGAPIRHLPYSTSSIWYNPAPCGASALAGGPAALRADSLRQPLYSAAADRCLVQPRRHSAGARQSPAAAVSGDPCDGSGCCQAPSSRRCSHEANDGTAAQQLRAATGFPSAAVGAFPASSSSSSGCSSTSTSPVVERRLLCGGDAISYFGGGGSGRQQLAGYGGLPLGGEEEGTEGSRRSGGSSFTASTTTYPWCYSLDQAASAFDERVCGSL